MNQQIEHLIATLSSGARVAYTVDAPATTKGEWWIDLEVDGMKTNVLWDRHQGFGLYTRQEGYGAKPQERFKSAAEASVRLLQLAAGWRRDHERRDTPSPQRLPG